MKIIYFDVSALLIMVVLLAVVFFKRMIRGDVNRYFLLLLCISIINAMTDIWAVYMDNSGSTDEIALYIAHTLYLMLHNCITPFFILYCTALTDSWFVGKYKNIKKTILCLPLAFTIVMLSSNLYHKKIFFIDEAGHYTRGPWFMLLYISAFVYVVYGVIKVGQCWKLFDIGRWMALFSGIGFMIVATGIQFFFPEALVEMLACALALLFILLMVQKPEEMFDAETGLLALPAFVSLMNHCERRDRKKQLILICMTNYKWLHAHLNYDQERVMAHGLADMMVEYASSFHERVEVYHLTRGKMAISVDDDVDPIVVRAIAKQIFDMLSQTMSVGAFEVDFKPCVCVCRFMEDITNSDTLMKFIEDLKHSNHTGEVVFAKDVFNKGHYDMLSEIDDILDRAIKENRFMVYYQPIFSVYEKGFRTAEALVRLNDEKYGFIPPDVFIPAAEKSGAILKIGQIVLEEVCRFISSDEYKKLGLHYIEVNMSVIQCMEENMVNDVLDTFRKYNVMARDVNMEITETAMSDEQQVMDRNINDLFNKGISFSLDDFGTGYSNMHRIASLPLSIIKIDKTLVDDATKTNMQIVIENTVKMIKALGMKIVVEGVETEQQLDQFVALRCDYIQGYYFSKPLPKDDFVAFIEKCA